MLKDKRLFLLDMDGTIYLGDRLFEGTRDFLSYVKKSGGRYLFLTNNSSRGTQAYVKRLEAMGIEAVPEDFLTSADACISYIKENCPDSVFYVCGTKSFKEQLKREGIALAESAEENPDTVLLGYDTELSYEKLENCCILLEQGKRYMATHPDLVCPTSYGYAPDCGSVIEMLYTATHRRPSVIIGKPKPEMALTAMKKTGFSPEKTCLIGDRIYTDIACGVNAGIDTVFVLSGEGVEEDIEKYGVHPAYVMKDIREVLNTILKGE